MYKSFTAARVARLIKDHGLSHAEFCIEEAESQLGKDKCAAARAEWNRIAREYGA